MNYFVYGLWIIFAEKCFDLAKNFYIYVFFTCYCNRSYFMHVLCPSPLAHTQTAGVNDETSWQMVQRWPSPAYKLSNLVWRKVIAVKEGGQLWELLLTHMFASTWSCLFSLPPLFALLLPLFCHLVNYGEGLILMKCTSLAMWFSVGFLRSTTTLSSLSRHLRLSQSRQAAKGKLHRPTADSINPCKMCCMIK